MTAERHASSTSVRSTSRSAWQLQPPPAFSFWVLRDSPQGYKLASALVVLSIWPTMVNFVPAMANSAAEEMAANVPASVISISVFFVAILATVMFKWGVVGVGASMLITRVIDFLVRLFPSLKRSLAWETTHIQPPGLAQRMIAFSWQSVATMVVALIVWDRSELFLLKHLCADIRQVSYYSVAFNMAERLLVSSAVFGSATGATIFAQYGRDKSKLPAITAYTFRYLALTSIPLHFISCALAFPALLLLYGNKYRDAALVVTLAPILCLAKAFIGPIQNLFQSFERQGYVISITVFAGIIDMGVAWYLIPAHGAVGACIGSGAAQFTAVGLIWGTAIYLYKIELPWLQITKITFASILATLAAHFVATHLAPLWAVLCGGIASLVVLFGLVYLMRILEPEDGTRFRILTGMLPAPIAGVADRFVTLLIGRDFTNDSLRPAFERPGAH